MENIVFTQLSISEIKVIFRQELERFFENQQPTPATDELLSVQQAAQFLTLSPATIYAMVQRRELPVSKRGGRLYFSKAELIDYVKAGRKKTAAEIAEQAAAYVVAKRKRG